MGRLSLVGTDGTWRLTARQKSVWYLKVTKLSELAKEQRAQNIVTEYRVAGKLGVSYGASGRCLCDKSKYSLVQGRKKDVVR